VPCGSLRADLASEHPLLWFSKDRPSTDIHTSRPVQSPPERGFLGLMLPSIRHLPSLSFLPTSTVYSANCSAGLLHPAASHGVRAVSSWASLPLCHHISWSSRPFPSSLLTPFEAFPSLKAVPRHRGRCHPAVASSHRFQCASAQPYGFTPSSSPLSAIGVSADDPPLLPWALFPFKALPSFRLPIWTAPEFARRSGLTLDHDHRGVRVLDVACTYVLAWLASACPSQRPAPRRVPSATAWPGGSAAGLPTEVSLPLSCPSRPLVPFFRFPVNSVGILPSCFMGFRDHLGSRWLWLHVSRVFGHMA